VLGLLLWMLIAIDDRLACGVRRAALPRIDGNSFFCVLLIGVMVGSLMIKPPGQGRKCRDLSSGFYSYLKMTHKHSFIADSEHAPQRRRNFILPVTQGAAAMQDYRAYALRPDGRIFRAHIMKCEDDKDALVQAHEFAYAADVEVWQSAREIGRIPHRSKESVAPKLPAFWRSEVGGY
jgi:hypothetical protein